MGKRGQMLEIATVPIRDVPPAPLGWLAGRVTIDPAVRRAAADVVALHKMDRVRPVLDVHSSGTTQAMAHNVRSSAVSKRLVELTAQEERVLFDDLDQQRSALWAIERERCGPCPLDESPVGPRSAAMLAAMRAWHDRCNADAIVSAKRREVSAMIGMLVAWNVGLVWYCARRVGADRHEERGDSVWADGLQSLMRAVESFDPSRGVKFSTFACMAIINNWNRVVQRSWLLQQRQRTIEGGGADGDNLQAEYLAADAYNKTRERRADLGAGVLESLRDLLAMNPREMAAAMEVPEIDAQTLRRRLLGMALHEIAAEDGCSKERVRQREMNAVASARAWALVRCGAATEIGLVESRASGANLTPDEREGRRRRREASACRRNAEKSAIKVRLMRPVEAE